MYHLKEIPSDAQIRKFLRRILFGKTIYCPECKSWDVIARQKRFYCKSCRKRFSLLSHTWLSHLRLPLAQFWLILWCWTNQIPVKQTEKLANISEKGVRHFFDLFRSHLPGDMQVLEAIVQLDEAYFGHFKGVALLMGKQKGTRKLAYQILQEHPARIDAFQFVEQRIKPKTIIYTDGSRIYQGLQRYYPVTHFAENHFKFEFTNTSEIEGVFGVLRTFIRRMYHHISKKNFLNIC